jgi:hypothetical protein
MLMSYISRSQEVLRVCEAGVESGQVAETFSQVRLTVKILVDSPR